VLGEATEPSATMRRGPPRGVDLRIASPDEHLEEILRMIRTVTILDTLALRLRDGRVCLDLDTRPTGGVQQDVERETS
jgi:hypothetical protein